MKRISMYEVTYEDVEGEVYTEVCCNLKRAALEENNTLEIISTKFLGVREV